MHQISTVMGGGHHNNPHQRIRPPSPKSAPENSAPITVPPVHSYHPSAGPGRRRQAETKKIARDCRDLKHSRDPVALGTDSAVVRPQAPLDAWVSDALDVSTLGPEVSRTLKHGCPLGIVLGSRAATWNSWSPTDLDPGRYLKRSRYPGNPRRSPPPPPASTTQGQLMDDDDGQPGER